MSANESCYFMLLVSEFFPLEIAKIFLDKHNSAAQCTEVHFASLLSGGFNTKAVMNPPENKTHLCVLDWNVNELEYKMKKV